MQRLSRKMFAIAAGAVHQPGSGSGLVWRSPCQGQKIWPVAALVKREDGPEGAQCFRIRCLPGARRWQKDLFPMAILKLVLWLTHFTEEN